MGIIVNQEDNRTELQKRIAAEMSDKAKKKSEPRTDSPDGVDDSRYIENTTQTTSHAWIWIALIAVLAIGAVVYFIVGGNRG
jgi:hypothetical protein